MAKRSLLRSFYKYVIFTRVFARCSVLQCSVFLAIVTGFLVFLHLIFEEPQWPIIRCPPTFYREGDNGGSIDDIKLNCSAIISGNTTEINLAWKYRTCTPNVWDETRYIYSSRNCDVFRSSRGYNSHKVTKEEIKFPIAFSILTYENIDQTERLLRSIYRPQNYYCIHADLNSRPQFREALAAICACFDNVFLARDPVRVYWSEISVVQAELNCMRDLLQYKGWKYYINLTGREFPLRTNWELVQILNAYNGGNDIDGTMYRRPRHWTEYSFISRVRTWRRKSPAPDGFNPAKGSTHIAAQRGFVEYAVYNKSAQRLFDWMADVYAPDEHFFPTLNHNPARGVPGAYTDNPDLKQFRARFKVWQNAVEDCDGTWWRFICNFGVGDLKRVVAAKELFANKFRIEFDPLALDCIEKWYMDRVSVQKHDDFDIEFYRNQKWVKNHYG